MSAAPGSVLVLGAAGYIGGGIAAAFRRAGWVVYGVGRSQRAVDAMQRAEVRPVRGSGFRDVDADLIRSCSIVIDAVGFTTKQESLANIHAVADGMLSCVRARASKRCRSVRVSVPSPHVVVPLTLSSQACHMHPGPVPDGVACVYQG